MRIKPSYESAGTEIKPTMLVALLGAMRYEKEKQKKKQEEANKEQEAKAEKSSSIPPSLSFSVSALCPFSFLSGRNQLKSLMSPVRSSGCLLYAHRPRADLPIFVERGRSYEEMPGSIGQMFEKQVCAKSKKGFR